jgi:hypothetical protein
VTLKNRIALIDDQLLGLVLRGSTPKVLATKDLYTTGYWYVRLCQAVVGANERTGVLSRPFAQLPADLQTKAMAALLELPPAIGLLSLRDLAPTIGGLRLNHQLNILNSEALAVACCLRAQVFLSTSSPMLEAALLREGLAVKILAPKIASKRKRTE